MKHQTCGNCDYVKFADIGGLKTPYCSFGRIDKNGPIVPHKSSLEYGNRGDKTVIIFWRIPLECGRPSAEVEKRPYENFAKKEEWLKVTV